MKTVVGKVVDLPDGRRVLKPLSHAETALAFQHAVRALIDAAQHFKADESECALDKLKDAARAI